MMDHCWDGFYTCQRRLQRFPALVDAKPGSVIDLTFTGAPAKRMQFWFKSQNNNANIIVRIHYPAAESKQLSKNGNVIQYNAWDESIKNYGPVKGLFCGENRFLGVQNVMEFFLNKGCLVEISSRDAIQCNVRMEWTFAEFFASGGTTTFVDRLSASLGIHASEIKVVSVYEGSLVIDYELVSSTGNQTALQEA